MIFITGDTHNSIDISKLNKKNFDESELTKEDFVIITGDFGFVWDNNPKKDTWWLKWFQDKNFTTLFVDGNHENHNRLDSFPVTEWNGGKVHIINDSVIHLMRGQVFELDGKTFFTMGGAESSDQEYRKENVSWWSREMPSKEEYQEALRNLDKHHWKVDYVITHAAPDNIQYRLCPQYNHNKLSNFLFTVDKDLHFKQWYFGHYHDDRQIDELHTLVYHNIINIDLDYTKNLASDTIISSLEIEEPELE